MKKSIFILDICIFGLSITALLIAFFKNLSNVNFLIGAGLISLMGVAQTRMAVITNLSKDNPKVKTMRRMNRLTVILAVALYFVPLNIMISSSTFQHHLFLWLPLCFLLEMFQQNFL